MTKSKKQRLRKQVAVPPVESIQQDDLVTREEGLPDLPEASQPVVPVDYPTWPTSKPGPQSTQPVTGQRPVNTIRSEQMVELNYNQVTGEPDNPASDRSLPDHSLQGNTNFDQQERLQK